MARGLSKNQIRILQIIDNMDNGGGPLHLVNGEIVSTFYPEVWEKNRKPVYTNKPTPEILYETTFKIKGDLADENLKVSINKYRVTVFKAIKSLMARGLLKKKVKVTNLYLRDKIVDTIQVTSIYITARGKEVINPK